MEVPFEINGPRGTNGRMLITNEMNGGRMFRRRSARMGVGTIEMLVLEVGEGVRVYVRQYENGFVEVIATRRDIYL